MAYAIIANCIFHINSLRMKVNIIFQDIILLVQKWIRKSDNRKDS